jgi:hypothetical protein
MSLGLKASRGAARAIAEYLRVLPQVSRNPDLAADVLVATVEEVSLRLTLHPPTERDPELFEKETVEMLLLYLTGSR